MSNRFERLFQLPQNQYIEGSPIILAAGVLSKDTDTGSIIAQLKFQSISEKRIKAVKVSLAAHDVSGTEIHGVNDYQYLELNIVNGQEFGANKAIVMPNPVTRSFVVSAITVVFNDGTVWGSSAPLAALPAAKPLSFGNAEMEKQYRIATNNSAQYEPAEDKGLWQCACGRWNSSNVCTHCCMVKCHVFSALDFTTLIEQMNIRLVKEREQREENSRIAAEQAAAKNRATKRIMRLSAIIGTPILVIALLYLFWINPYIIQPKLQLAEKEEKYTNALNLIYEKEFEQAYQEFLELGEYKDSRNHLNAFKWVCIEEYAPGDHKTVYNEKGQPVHQDVYYIDNTIDYEYNDLGQLIKTIEKDTKYGLWETVTYTYNELGLVATEKQDSSYAIYLIEYTYDENGFLVYEKATKCDKEDGSTYEYWYETSYKNNEDGQVVKSASNFDDGEKFTTTYEYDQNGNWVKRVGSTVFTYTYNENGHCTSWTEDGGSNRTYKAEYTYDQHGNITSMVETFYTGETQETTYSYRLIYTTEEADS